MTIPYNFDPLGSGNADPYEKGQVLVEIANPQAWTEQVIDVPKPGVYQVWLIGGGNPQCWCYIGCNGSGGAAGFIGKMYFNVKCHLKIGVAASKEDSLLQVASWGTSTWYNLIQANHGNAAPGVAGSGGSIIVNRGSTFNNYFDIELERNGNGGTNATGCAASRGKSIWNGYGSGEVNGYGKLEYIRMRQ